MIFSLLVGFLGMASDPIVVQEGFETEIVLEVDSDNVLVAATWEEELGAEDPNITLSYRLSGEEEWSDEVSLEASEKREGIAGVEPYSLFYADAVRLYSSSPANNLTAIVISDPKEARSRSVASSIVSKSFDTGFHGLKINTRAAWGADESKMTWTPKANNIKGAVIHHTESSNNYTQDQVAQQIRNIYHYHAVTLGWGDIGYNIIVDKYGGVWEGRSGGLAKQIHAAHAGNSNGTTFGITVMGSFMKDAPSQYVQDQVAKTIAWKFKIHGVSNPLGTAPVLHQSGQTLTLPKITGHRDVGWTDCPGDAFYARIPIIKAASRKRRGVHPHPMNARKPFSTPLLV